MSEEITITEELSQVTEENIQATEAVDTKKSGRSQRSEKQKAALAAARAKAMEVRKQKAEIKKLENSCKSNNVIDPDPIENSNQVINDENVEPPPSPSSNYVTQHQLDEALASRSAPPKKKYKYVDGYYIKQ